MRGSTPWRAEPDSNRLPSPVLVAAHPHVLSARMWDPSALPAGSL